MANSVTVNNHTYTDDSDPLTGLGNGGHRTRFLPLISDTMVELAGAVTATEAAQVAAEASRSASAIFRAGAEAANTLANSAAATATAAANFLGKWSGLSGAVTVPSSVYHGGKFWALLVGLADVAASEPTAVNTDWVEIPAGASAYNLAVAGGYVGTLVDWLASLHGGSDVNTSFGLALILA